MKTAFLIFSLLLILFSLKSNAGLPPTTLGGQHSASKATTFNFKVPNNSATQTNGTESLIETGNKNILDNPSFEHSSYLTSWTPSGTGTRTEETSVLIDGKKSLKIVTSSQTIDLSQSSTLYQAQLADGAQCLASVRIKTDLALSVCAVQAGTVSTTDCVTTNTDSKWGLYKVPFVCGGTSNGISIVGASGSGTTYIDDAFVGPQDLKQDIPNIGPWISFTPTGSWVSNTTYTGRHRQVGENLEVQYYWTTSGAPTSAGLSLNLPSGFVIDTAKLANSTLGNVISRNGVLNDSSTNYYTASASYKDTTSVYIQAENASATYETINNNVTQSVPFTWGASDIGFITITVPVTQFAGSSSVYTSSCGANCVDTFSAAVSSSDVVSGENIDWINGDCTNATTGKSTCTFNSGVFTATPNCVCEVTNGGTGDNTCHIDSVSSSSVVMTGSNNNTNTNFNLSLICQKQGADFKASRTIVGTFKEVMTAPGINKPKTCYYAFGGASATLVAPTECSTGTCVEVYDSCGTGTPPAFSSTGLYTSMTFANGTWENSTPIKCSVYAASVTNGSARQGDSYFTTGNNTWSSNSSGGYVTNIISYNGTSLANGYFHLSCTGEAP